MRAPLLPCLTALPLVLSAPALADVPRVAVDIAPVHALVAQVMAGVGEPALILPPTASPHGYAMRPSEAAAVQEADLLVWVGEGLTPWLADALDSLAADAARLELMELEGVVRLGFREGATFEAHDHDHGGHDHDHAHGDQAHDEHAHGDHAHGDHAHGEHAHEEHAHGDHAHGDHAHGDHAHGDHDHAHGDHAHDHDHDHAHAHDDHAHDHDHDHAHAEHGAAADAHHGHDHGDFDPHGWLDPVNAALWLGAIAAELARLDPDNAATYAANAAAGQAELAALQAEIAGRMAPLAGRFIVFHDGYHYFEARFDIEAAGAISLSDASEPGPARVAELRDLVATQDISCVFAEPQFNPGLVNAVFGETGTRIGVLDPYGATLEPGPALYADVLRGIAASFEACLAPR